MTDVPDCRSCGAPLRHTFIDLGEQPLSNGFLTREQLEASDDPRYPLHARVCDRCLLVQVDEVVPADVIFSDNYAYFSSYSVRLMGRGLEAFTTPLQRAWPPNSISGLWGVWDLLARHTSCRRLLEVVLEQGQPLSEDLVLIG